MYDDGMAFATPRRIRPRRQLVDGITAEAAHGWTWLYLGHAQANPPVTEISYTPATGQPVLLKQYRMRPQQTRGRRFNPPSPRRVAGEIYAAKDEATQRVFWAWNRWLPAAD